VYFAYQANDGHQHVAVSKDKGQTWSRDTDVGAAPGIQNSVFPAIVAGDGDRAAVAFFGTTTSGANYHCGQGDNCADDTGANPQPPFTGVWYLYIATTYDGGATWTTVNATPNDPIQRGGICGAGDCRNLLDFFDATIDKEGRVLVGYDDGCVSADCIAGTSGNDFTAKAAVARQLGGKRMFAAYDPNPNATPDAYPDGDANSNSDRNSNADPDGDTYSDANRHPDTNREQRAALITTTRRRRPSARTPANLPLVITRRAGARCTLRVCKRCA
jgi:hypothetical protein